MTGFLKSLKYLARLSCKDNLPLLAKSRTICETNVFEIDPVLNNVCGVMASLV